jgi:hypothetical protein
MRRRGRQGGAFVAAALALKRRNSRELIRFKAAGILEAATN